MRLILLRGPVKPIPPPTRNDAHLLSVFWNLLVKLWLHCCLQGGECVWACMHTCAWCACAGLFAKVLHSVHGFRHAFPSPFWNSSLLLFCTQCADLLLMCVLFFCADDYDDDLTDGTLFCPHVSHAYDVFFLGWSGNLQDCIVCCLFVFEPWKWSHGKGSRSSNSQYTRVTANPCKSGST